MTRIRQLGLATMLLLALSACVNVGTQVENFSVASQPNGAMATIQTSSGVVNGELLAVQDDGVIVLNNSLMELVPYHTIQSLQLKQLGNDYTIGDHAPDSPQRSRLGAVSRYPQGINAELRQRLLTQLGQPEIRVIR